MPVVVLPTTSKTKGAPPVFEILGGPGAAATSAASFFANELPAMRETGDIVLVDQRGTGNGPSNLACPQLDDAPLGTVFDDATLGACLASLWSRADLRFYGTEDVVRDLEDARVALGYDQIRIEAISYGTRVAQIYLRHYGTHVRSVVMFGAVALDVHLPAEFAQNAQAVLDTVLDACSEEPACAAAFPHLRDKLSAIDTHLSADLNRTIVTERIRHLLYSANDARQVPRLLAEAAVGDLSELVKLPKFGAHDFRNAVLLTISCSEDEPMIERETARALAQKTWFGTGRLDWQHDVCAHWPRYEVPTTFYAAVASPVPVLVFAGGRDPVTPASYAARATAQMPHATIVNVPAMGHDIDGLVGDDCIDQLELAFLHDPAQPLDTSCVAHTAAPPFELTRRSGQGR